MTIFKLQCVEPSSDEMLTGQRHILLFGNIVEVTFAFCRTFLCLRKHSLKFKIVALFNTCKTCWLIQIVLSPHATPIFLREPICKNVCIKGIYVLCVWTEVLAEERDKDRKRAWRSARSPAVLFLCFSH